MVNAPPGRSSAPDGGDEGAADAALMRRTVAGDRAAFEALYRRYAAPVMSFLHHLCFDRGLAEDATQEVFVKAWRSARTFRLDARFSTWLFQIAKNHAYGEIPRWKRRRAAGGGPSSGDAVPAGRPDRSSRAAPESDLRRAEIAHGIEAALDALSEKLRIAFVLVRLEGRSYAETAEILEVPEGTVKSRMAAAESALRERLGKFL